MEQNGFSIIIPTYHEAKNIQALIHRIAQVNFKNQLFEVLLVDDNSQDGTLEIVHQLQSLYSWVRILVRKSKRDLSQSVIDGFQHAQYPTLVTIDADLSHPPEKIPDMLNALAESNVDAVLGSRYVKGGSMDEVWPLTRKIASRVAALIAIFLLRINLKDPLSGFVAIQKKTLLAGDPLNVVGWKWGLEILIKCHCKKIREVPIHFSQRKQGYSKLTFKVILNYFLHVKRLLIYKLKGR